MGTQPRYKAFISYSHDDDNGRSALLQTALHRIARPWYRLRALRVFRDETNTSASAELWPDIVRAMERSEFLIVMASPQSARSVWVGREIEWWMDHRSANEILIVKLSGDIVWDEASNDFDQKVTTAIHPKLQGKFGAEPLHIDLSWAQSDADWQFHNARFRLNLLRLAAKLHDKSPDELGGEDVRVYRRNLVAAWTAAVFVAVGSAAAVWQAVLATQARNVAQTREQQAVDAQRRADQSADAEKKARQSESEQRHRAEIRRVEAERAAQAERVALSAESTQRQRAQKQEREARRLLAVSLLRQADRAAHGGDEQTAQVLSARAIAVADSQDIRDRFLKVQYVVLREWKKIREPLVRLMREEEEDALSAATSASRAERIARSIAADPVLPAWLRMTAAENEHGYEHVLRFKGLLSRVERAVRNETRVRVPPARREEISRLESDVARLSYVKPERSELIRWGDELRRASTKLAEAHADVARLGSQTARLGARPVNATWSEIQHALGETEAIVDFMRHEDHYIAWIIKRQGKPVRVTLANAQMIEERVDGFLKRMKGGLRDEESPASVVRGVVGGGTARENRRWLGSALREAVWAPIERELGETVAHIYIVPDGPLAKLPFAALPGAGGAGQALIDERSISYLASAHDLLADRSPTSATRGILLVAPDFATSGGGRSAGNSTPSDRREFASCISGLTPLPGTVQEVRDIAQMFRELAVDEVFRLAGPHATEGAVRQAVKGKKILHFATHAWADLPCERPAIDIWKMEQFGAAEVEAFLVSLDPALRSGLALLPGGAEGDGRSDGILSSMEVASMDLRGTDLAVLSGCDTVGSPIGSSGVVGLVRAFQEAGVSSVLASLVMVEDLSTAELMAEFYRHLWAGTTYAEALRRAAREMKRKRPEPLFWASFVVYGVGRATMVRP